MGGGPSVPSNTTQTTMLDPTRQKGLQKALGYLDKWTQTAQANPVYRGQRVAALPQEWYTARNLATRMGNRLAEGGITSVRRFADGGDTAYDSPFDNPAYYSNPDDYASYFGPGADNTYTQDQFDALNTPTTTNNVDTTTFGGSTAYDNTYGNPAYYSNPDDYTSYFGPGAANTYTQDQFDALNTPTVSNTPATTTSALTNNNNADIGPTFTTGTTGTTGAINSYNNADIDQALTDLNSGGIKDVPITTADNLTLDNADTTTFGGARAGTTDTTGVTPTDLTSGGIKDVPITTADNLTLNNGDTTTFGGARAGTTDTTDTTDTTGATPTDLGAYSVYNQAEDLQKLATAAALSSVGLKPGDIANSYKAGTYTAPTITADQAKGRVSNAYNAGTYAAPTITADQAKGRVSNAYNAGTYTAPTFTTPTMKAAGVTTNKISDAEIAKAMTANPNLWNSAFMRKYMSPYTQGIVDISKREADRQYQQQLQQQKAQATASGAFGGYRQGVVEAEGARNQAQLLNDIQTKGMQDAYNAATAQFNADRQALMQTGQFNATQAAQIAGQNLQARISAESQRSAQAQAANSANQQADITMQGMGAQYKLAGFNANEAAKQAQNQAAMEAQRQNIATELANAQNRLTAKQATAQYGLAGFNANEAAKQAQNTASMTAQQQNIATELANAQNRLTADQSTAQYGLAGFNANEAAKQAQNTASMTAQGQNIANALAAENLDLAAIQQAMAGAQGLAGIETQYQNAGLNVANAQANLAANKQAYDQAILNANLATTDEEKNFWLKVSNAYASVIGTMPGGSTQVTLK